MAVRKVVNARQMQAAQLLIAGQSAYRALRTAGYSHYTARNFGALLRQSWGLREALRQATEASGVQFRPAPARRRRYDRRAVAEAIKYYCDSSDHQAVSNAGVRWLHEQVGMARAIAEGKPLPHISCSVCGGRTEGNDHWCPRCLRIEA